MEGDIANLRYLLDLLDETAPSKDGDGRVDILPVYREIRARISGIMCQQKDLEERLDILREQIDSADGMSNVKVLVKRIRTE